MSIDQPQHFPAAYTDGTLVQAGDRIRYHQAPGGLMAPASRDGDYVWQEGVAAQFPSYVDLTPERREQARTAGVDVDGLYLHATDGRFYDIVGHVVERAA